ncbi:hypothetical protein SLEP1_g36750 [Rubroshorea leprosula]|uniref:Uncharacterized protein n=1 Tax=Rubroshorea leprosula TaxID=152421 RepID=A0AAV5KSX4_9ROSI|nr:hypothetical protein SLEP1_g36750 [Rubroshorea leprosula]
MAKVAEEEGKDPQLQRQDPEQLAAGAIVAIVEELATVILASLEAGEPKSSSYSPNSKEKEKERVALVSSKLTD